MEKKYRFGKPKVSAWGTFRRYSSFIYAIAAWNLLGFCVYKMIDNKERETNENWDKLSSTEKYLSKLNIGGSTLQSIRIKGVSVESD